MPSRSDRSGWTVETARPANPADVVDLVRLWDQAVSELDGQRGGWLLAGSLDRPDLEGFLTGAISDPQRLLVLGFIDAVPVGVASTFVDRLRREPVANLELIFVEASARQVGVAEAMLEVVTAWAGSIGVVGIDAPALPGNRSAKSFFEVHGFQARLLVMHRPGTGAGAG